MVGEIRCAKSWLKDDDKGLTFSPPRKAGNVQHEKKDWMNAGENQIVVYQPDDTTRLSVRFDGETVWLSQEQMIDLFQRDRSVISRHIANAFKEGEVDKENCLHILQTNTKGRPEVFYNLEVVTSVGYRVKSLRGVLFRRWATRVLKEYLLRGYSFNARMSHLEDKVDRRLAQHDQAIFDLQEKVDFFVQTQTPPLQGVFYDGQLWDARALILKLVSGAKRSLILIDNWATAATLDLFAKKRKGVKVTIITSKHFKKGVPHPAISDVDIETFNGQYPKLVVRYNETFHDRFLIVDDKELYLIGASLKDLGHKCFGFTKMDTGAIRGIKKSAFSSISAVKKRKGMVHAGMRKAIGLSPVLQTRAGVGK